MTYSIGQVSELLHIPVSTLRYYDKEGLLPLINRTGGNIRIFDDSDVECLKMIECLKNTGLPLKEIKQYFQWCEAGDSTINQRYELFLEQKKRTLEQIQLLESALDRIEFKCEFYRVAKEKGTTNLPGLREEIAMKFLQHEGVPAETA